jgi:hypothetical protein
MRPQGEAGENGKEKGSNGCRAAHGYLSEWHDADLSIAGG